MTMRTQTSISERRACRLVGISRTAFRYQPTESARSAVLQSRLIELAAERRRFGYRRLHVLIRRGPFCILSEALEHGMPMMAAARQLWHRMPVCT